MKIYKYSRLLLAFIPSLLIGCNNQSTSSIDEKITVTFVQRQFVKFSYDESGENNGYYFKNEDIATTKIEFEKGHFLSQEEIDEIKKEKITYKVPELNGDGYWSFTFFVTEFDNESGFASNYLKPQTITKEFNVYFAIYGQKFIF